jgi:hypothetical protein
MKAEYICADQPVTLIFRLRQSGGPYIPVCSLSAQNDRCPGLPVCSACWIRPFLDPSGPRFLRSQTALSNLL